jgi:hypothetical protein
MRIRDLAWTSNRQSQRIQRIDGQARESLFYVWEGPDSSYSLMDLGVTAEFDFLRLDKLELATVLADYEPFTREVTDEVS